MIKLYRSTKKNIKFFQSKSVRMFANREEAFKYLENDVFNKQDFLNNVSETALSNKVSYVLAYELITNFLTDILYEIDQATTMKRKKKKINVYSYFFLEIGFMISLRNRKMFLEKYITK